MYSKLDQREHQLIHAMGTAGMIAITLVLSEIIDFELNCSLDVLEIEANKFEKVTAIKLKQEKSKNRRVSVLTF